MSYPEELSHDAGLTAVLAVAAMGSATTAMTAGDLVLVQGLLLQLWGPLQVPFSYIVLDLVCWSLRVQWHSTTHVCWCSLQGRRSSSFCVGVGISSWGPCQCYTHATLDGNPASHAAASNTLQFLGWFYRELRQSLVDLDAFLKVPSRRPPWRCGPLSESCIVLLRNPVGVWWHVLVCVS